MCRIGAGGGIQAGLGDDLPAPLFFIRSKVTVTGFERLEFRGLVASDSHLKRANHLSSTTRHKYHEATVR